MVFCHLANVRYHFTKWMLTEDSKKCITELETICMKRMCTCYEGGGEGGGVHSTLHTNKSVDTGEQTFAANYF